MIGADARAIICGVVQCTDSKHLLSEQYNDDAKLNVRLALHERFGTNPYAWHRWVFDQMSILPGDTILEIGCGSGTLWLKNRDRLPEPNRFTLSDFSLGMLTASRQALSEAGFEPRFAGADGQALPFAAETFDVVIANHMLYHVPNRAQAIDEFRRVLRPGGRMYAATNGRNHLQELVGAFADRIDDLDQFGLESGVGQLERSFLNVEVRRYDDALAITEVEPALAYIRSVWPDGVVAEEELDRLRASIESAIASEGAYHVTKDAGLLIATL